MHNNNNKQKLNQEQNQKKKPYKFSTSKRNNKSKRSEYYGEYTGEKGLNRVLSDIQRLVFNIELKYSDDRVDNVYKYLGDKEKELHESIRSFIETDKYVAKQIKKKNSFLSESDPFSNGLSYIADYILKVKFKNAEHEQETGTSITKEYPIISKDRVEKNARRETNISNLLKLIERIDNAETKDEMKDALIQYKQYIKPPQRFEKFSQTIKKDKFPRKYLLPFSQYKIKDFNEVFEPYEYEFPNLQTDFEKFPELIPQFLYIKQQKKNLNYGKSKYVRNQTNERYLDMFHKKLNRYGHCHQTDKYTYGYQTRKLEGKELIDYLITQRKSEIARECNEYDDYEKLIRIDDQLDELRSGRIPNDCPEVYKEFYTTLNHQEQINNHTVTLKYHQPIGFPEGYTSKKLLYVFKKQLSDMEYELDVMKDQLRKPIRIVNPGSSNIYDFDYSGTQFSDPKVIYELMLNYYGLWERHKEEADDVWAALLVFDKLVEAVGMNKEEQFVINMLKFDYDQRVIVKVFNQVMKTEYSNKIIRKMIEDKIPRKIADFYNQDKEEYLMDEYGVQGKMCTKCRLIKLPTKRNFGEDVRKTDNLKSICRDCINKQK